MVEGEYSTDEWTLILYKSKNVASLKATGQIV